MQLMITQTLPFCTRLLKYDIDDNTLDWAFCEEQNIDFTTYRYLKPTISECCISDALFPFPSTTEDWMARLLPVPPKLESGPSVSISKEIGRHCQILSCQRIKGQEFLVRVYDVDVRLNPSPEPVLSLVAEGVLDVSVKGLVGWEIEGRPRKMSFTSDKASSSLRMFLTKLAMNSRVKGEGE